MASGFGWVIGLLWLSFGLALAFASPEAKMRTVGVGFIPLATFILPPVTRWLRGMIPPLRPPAVPTVAVVILAVVLLVANAPEPSKLPARTGTPVATEANPPKAAPQPSHPAVDIVVAGDVLRPAQDALNTGDIDLAIALFFDRPVPAGRRARPDAKKLLAAIQAASDRQLGRDPAADFIDRVDTYWLPALEKVPTSGAVTADQIREGRLLFEELARELEESESLSVSPELAGSRQRLIAAAKAKQRAAFPIWRQAYAAQLDHELWEQNIDVKVLGQGARTIRFTGPLFAANANIAASQRSLSEALKKLRFSRAAYRWMPNADGWSYGIDVPGDSQVGYWDGAEFRLVE